MRDGDDGSYYDGCGTVGAGRGKWEVGWPLSLQENPRPGVYMTAAVANLSYHMDVGQHAMQQAQGREWKCRPGGCGALPSFWPSCHRRCLLSGRTGRMGVFPCVVPPGGRDAPLCVSCGKQMSCHKQAAVVSSAAFLLLEVNRTEGSMCSLSGFDNIRVNKECMVFVESRCKVFLAGTL